MIAQPTMQLLGWAASKATESVVDRFAGRAARRVRARAATSARKLVSEKRQLLSGLIAR